MKALLAPNLATTYALVQILTSSWCAASASGLKPRVFWELYCDGLAGRIPDHSLARFPYDPQRTLQELCDEQFIGDSLHCICDDNEVVCYDDNAALVDYCLDDCICEDADADSRSSSKSSLTHNVLNATDELADTGTSPQQTRAGNLAEYKTQAANGVKTGTSNAQGSCPNADGQSGQSCQGSQSQQAPAPPTEQNPPSSQSQQAPAPPTEQKPPSSAGSASAVYPPATKDSSATCRGSCRNTTDCSNSDSCSCSAKRTKIGTHMRWLANCIATLSPRGLDTEPFAASEGHICPCNSTYLSSGCCGSLTGMVWEDPSMNQGVLGDDDWYQ